MVAREGSPGRRRTKRSGDRRERSQSPVPKLRMSELLDDYDDSDEEGFYSPEEYRNRRTNARRSPGRRRAWRTQRDRNFSDGDGYNTPDDLATETEDVRDWEKGNAKKPQKNSKTKGSAADFAEEVRLAIRSRASQDAMTVMKFIQVRFAQIDRNRNGSIDEVEFSAAEVDIGRAEPQTRAVQGCDEPH